MNNNFKTETDEKLLNAVLKAAAEEAWQEEMDSLPSLDELNEMYPSSESLDKRVFGTINKAARLGKIKKAARISARCVAAFCVAIVFIGGALMSVEASRTFILSRIINMGDDFVHIHFQLGYVSDLGVSELAVGYMPDDFTFYDDGKFSERHTYYLFKSDTRRGIMIQHLIASEDMGAVSMVSPVTEYGELSIVYLNGQAAYLFISTDESMADTISWVQGRHFISVSAWIGLDELLEVAGGIILR